jgi:hypothetical protein
VFRNDPLSTGHASWVDVHELRCCTSHVLRRVATFAALLVAVLGLMQPADASGRWGRKLHRPLQLPHLAPAADCPVSSVDSRIDWPTIQVFGGYGIGRGPVYPATGPSSELTVRPDAQYGGPWLRTKLFWYVRPSYRGPVLIRGRQLDGTHRLGFNGRELPRWEIHIRIGQTVGWTGQPSYSRGVPSDIRARVPGCYGVQIDGTRFSRIVIFRVTD